jgi:tRNA dimethylallyltransferase
MLYYKLDQRTEQMFRIGLVEETQSILARGFPASVKPFESHGYRQALQMLNGELSFKDAVFYAQRNTRRYAKRQMTWFRQEACMEWHAGFGDEARIEQAVLDRVSEFLRSFRAEAPSRN